MAPNRDYNYKVFFASQDQYRLVQVMTKRLINYNARNSRNQIFYIKINAVMFVNIPSAFRWSNSNIFATAHSSLMQHFFQSPIFQHFKIFSITICISSLRHRNSITAVILRNKFWPVSQMMLYLFTNLWQFPQSGISQLKGEIQCNEIFIAFTQFFYYITCCMLQSN